MLRLAGLLADRAVAAAAVLLLLALLACVFLGVVFRLVNQPLAWSDEMAQYLMVWTAFVGWILAARRRSHIRITVVIDQLPPPLRRGAEVLIQLAVAALGMVLLSRSFGLIERNFDVEWVSLPLSAALVYVPMPIAGFAVVAQALVEIAEVLAGARRRDSEAGAAP
ncbi:TRAP-type C4-dicarboxylate transport system permease small subunit [Chelatococcus caeni]|uniref:TRAP transporter small permease protein n=1 Tax=Chelatococcus caeni TaxID=1348468 RepID=A0A840BYX7_9HYPH|nr:TRAP transporter small permease [Chelatococcus caeni]MBB4016922.1 TRAP-type C4-dicarboxylate transport system permease small subunit [Chelatococcus caeni]